MTGYVLNNKRDGGYYDPYSTGIMTSKTDDHIDDLEIYDFLKECADEKFWVQNTYFGKKHLKEWAREILRKYEES